MTPLLVSAAVAAYVIVGAGVAVCTAYSRHLHHRLEHEQTDWGDVATSSIAAGMTWPLYGLVLACIRVGRVLRRQIEAAAERRVRQREGAAERSARQREEKR